jgi:hypothetical protein
MRKLLLIAVIFASPTHAQDHRVSITFSAQNQQYAEAAEEYRRLWADQGTRMIQAMERVSGLKFAETELKAVIYEGPSNSGFGSNPMNLRASYPMDVKKATLVHELSHRMNAQLKKRPKDLDEHRILFLYLYDVWESLYGKDFADQQVEVEKRRKGLYDYESAWNWALSMNRDERASKFEGILRANLK